MPSARRIFVAATRQNDGKTVVSLGLVLALRKKVGRVGFMKPVGQRYVLVDGERIDKDAVLMRSVCGIGDSLRDVNPVSVEEGFTRKYLDDPRPAELHDAIIRSFERIAAGKDFVVIEGTGHAGVGSVFDLSNAAVARLLDAPVLLVSVGGIGKPLDEIALNAPLFEKHGVPVRGVVVNKLLPEKRDVVGKYAAMGLARMGIDLLGLVPFSPGLTAPSISLICEAVQGRAIAGEDRLGTSVNYVIVGAMTPRHALDHFRPRSVLVTPGDREDMILAALSKHSVLSPAEDLTSGIILTGGLMPHKTIVDLIKKADLPTVMTSLGTYEVASAIHDLVAKIRAEDSDKIATAERLVEENVDLGKILSMS